VRVGVFGVSHLSALKVVCLAKRHEGLQSLTHPLTVHGCTLAVMPSSGRSLARACLGSEGAPAGHDADQVLSSQCPQCPRDRGTRDVVLGGEGGHGWHRLIVVLCVPKTSSTSCDQAIFVDQAADVSVFSDAVLVEVDRFG
jgi:hypothetical protein